MTFAPIALTDIPEAVKGAKAKTLTDADVATANAVIAILASGNAARSGDAFETKALADSAGRKMTGLLARIAAAPEGTAYRFRTMPSGRTVTVPAVAAVPADGDTPAVAAVPAHDVPGITFAIVYGDPAKPRKATA
jgi:hypothetical protein